MPLEHFRQVPGSSRHFAEHQFHISLWRTDGNSLLLFPSEMPFIFAEKCFPAVNDYILKAAFKIGGGGEIFFVPLLLLGEIVSYVIMAGVVLSVTLSNSLRFFNRKHYSEKHRRKPFQLLRGVAAQKVPLSHCFCIFFLIGRNVDLKHARLGSGLNCFLKQFQRSQLSTSATLPFCKNY